MTPEREAEFQAILAKHNYQPPQTAADTSWLDSTAPVAPKKTFVQRVQKTQSNAADQAGAAYKEGADSILANFDNMKKSSEGADPVSKILHALVFAGHTAGDIAATTGKVALAAGKAAVSPFSAIEAPDGQTIGEHFATPIAETTKKIVTKLAETHPEIIDWTAKQVDAHPDIAKGIGDLFNTLALTGVGKAATTPLAAPEKVAATLKTGVQDLIKSTADTAKATAGKVKTTAGKVKDAAASIKNKVAPVDTSKVIPSIATVDRHLASTQQIIDEGVAKADNPELLARLKTNIVDGLKAEGDKAGAAKVEALTGTFKTPDEFATAAKDALKSSGSAQKTIEAIDPELKGTKKIDAYKAVVTGKTTIKNHPGWVTEQSLTPSEQAVKIGTRLHESGIQLSGRPTQDLETLGGAMKSTETRIGELLKGKDPSVVYNADKPTLIESLAEIKNKTPREFGSIKDSKAVYDNVVEFAQELVTKTDDTVAGIRDARTAFDVRARIEYPTAFKNGAIDTKNPAGVAIKAARDTMNEHLYNTAPEGSEIKTLIQREADIFRAAEGIAPKAAKGDELTKMEQYLIAFKQHPYITTGGALLATYGGFKFLTGGGGGGSSN